MTGEAALLIIVAHPDGVRDHAESLIEAAHGRHIQYGENADPSNPKTKLLRLWAQFYGCPERIIDSVYVRSSSTYTVVRGKGCLEGT